MLKIYEGTWKILKTKSNSLSGRPQLSKDSVDVLIHKHSYTCDSCARCDPASRCEPGAEKTSCARLSQLSCSAALSHLDSLLGSFFVWCLCHGHAFGISFLVLKDSYNAACSQNSMKEKTIQFPLKIPRFWVQIPNQNWLELHRCTGSSGKSDLLFHMKVVSIFCRTGRIASLVVRNLCSYWQTDVVSPCFAARGHRLNPQLRLFQQKEST